MSLWTCPNERCPFDDRLEPDAQCPLCERKALGFDFRSFGELLKKKKDNAKSLLNTHKSEKHMSKAKFCPRCGSPRIDFLIYYRPSLWKCQECGYEGSFLIEGVELARKIRESYKKRKDSESTV
jgi:DNA-directed RNA polymerase subunit M